jgi:hypothetical protein
MAFTPCSAHGKLYKGGASSFFLRLVAGNTATGGKLQFCPDCASVVLDWLRDHAVKVSEGDTFYEYSMPLACGNCGGDLGGNAVAFFGNAYPRGMRESQWYAQVCAECVDAVITDLYLNKAAQRPS